MRWQKISASSSDTIIFNAKMVPDFDGRLNHEAIIPFSQNNFALQF